MNLQGFAAVCGLLLWAGAATGENFTTAAEIKPILAATKANWVALRDYDGHDLLYFTHLESWRCGLSQVSYAINDGAFQVWQMDPCFDGTPQPNAIAAERLPYTVLPPGSVARVAVQIVFDDGSTDAAVFERAAVLMQ